MDTLLDYSEYKRASRSGEFGWGDIERLGWQLECPFCDIQIVPIFCPAKPWNLHAEFARDELSILRIFGCVRCGWWQMEETWHTDTASHSAWFSCTASTLRKYSIDSKEAPIASLREHLSSNPLKIHHINPTSLERLVESVFRDHFNCDVRHVGRSHDRGIDLFLVHSDFTMPIQVKRRSDRNHTESVQAVREMFGVLFRDGFRNAAVVTSAKDFSREAKLEVDDVVNSGRCDRFELINREAFLQLIRSTEKSLLPPWRQLLPISNELTEIILRDEMFQSFRASVVRQRSSRECS